MGKYIKFNTLFIKILILHITAFTGGSCVIKFPMFKRMIIN